MNYLLDTHTLIWSITNDPQLPSNLKQLITKENNDTFFVSVGSFWELAIKISLGRLEMDLDIKSVFEIAIASGFSILAIAPEHILKLSSLPFHHRDPFDRLLVVQSISENLTLITKDHVLKKYDCKILW